MSGFFGHVMDAVKAVLEGVAVGLGAGLVIALPILAVVFLVGGVYWVWDQYMR